VATIPTAIAPPIRSSLVDPNQPADRPTASRDWYLFFQGLAQNLAIGLLQTNASTHPDRLAQPVERFPDGALWFETDRNVLYAMWNGRWTYLSGTMYGTLSPDQRPTDLGAADSGFEFRSTDTPARQFIWSGGGWVEVTPAHYGTHAGRLALALTNVADGGLYVETDRGGVIYQNRGGTWKYVGGVMWGTISPDQRPTDLGANDYGFDFRDSNNAPFREYVWNGSAWSQFNFPQTPWTSNIDAAGFELHNAGKIGVGTASPTGLLTALGAVNGGVANAVDIGNNVAQAVGAAVRLRMAPSGIFVGSPTVAPYMQATQMSTATSACDITFGTFNGGTLVEVMRLQSNGDVNIPGIYRGPSGMAQLLMAQTDVGAAVLVEPGTIAFGYSAGPPATLKIYLKLADGTTKVGNINVV
jgi:hypothetical protein